MPAIDQKVLQVAGGLPASTIVQRRAQKELCCRLFPELAALPLDRNGHETYTLRPRLRQQLARLLADRLQPLRRLLPRWQRGGPERRRYYRVFDIHTPGWRAIRQQADLGREHVGHLFHREVLDALLPPAHLPVRVEGDPISRSAGLKSLIGFLLWSRDHLP